jgi:hypothetical protein
MSRGVILLMTGRKAGLVKRCSRAALDVIYQPLLLRPKNLPAGTVPDPRQELIEVYFTIQRWPLVGLVAYY